MNYLMNKEINGLRQDIKNASAQQEAEKEEYKKKLLDGMGEEMKDVLENPENGLKYIKYAKKAEKKKRRARWKENLKKMLGFKNNPA